MTQHLVFLLIAMMGAVALTYQPLHRTFAGAAAETLDALARGVKLTAMGYLGEARNAALKKIGEEATFFGVFKMAAATTAWKSTSSSILEKTAHGLETGNIIFIKAMTEGGSGLVKTGEFFYVKKVSTSTIELSQTESFVQETWSVEIKGTVEFQLLEETTTTRVKVEWKATAEKAKLTSKEKYECVVAEGKVVAVVGYWTEVSGGTATVPKNVRVLEKVAEETVGASKAYVVTEANYDLLSQ